AEHPNFQAARKWRNEARRSGRIEAKRSTSVYKERSRRRERGDARRIGLMATTTAGREEVPVAPDLERRTRAIGRELFEEVGRGPSPFERGWWDDRMMALTMGDPRVKVQLFRFIDALPALTSADSVVRHLREYLEQAEEFVPWFMKLGIDLAPEGTLRGEALAWLARTSATHMARRF